MLTCLCGFVKCLLLLSMRQKGASLGLEPPLSSRPRPRMLMPIAPATKMIGATPDVLSVKLPERYCRGCMVHTGREASCRRTSGQAGSARSTQAYLNRKDVLLTGRVLVGVAEALRSIQTTSQAAGHSPHSVDHSASRGRSVLVGDIAGQKGARGLGGKRNANVMRDRPASSPHAGKV